MNSSITLSEKIESRRAKVGIIGMGYVGSSLAKATVGAGFTTLGFDVDERRVAEINSEVNALLSATRDTSLLSTCDIVCICVPTLCKDNQPDLSILLEVLETVTRNLQKQQLIVIESSVAPGTTRSTALPLLETSGLQVEKDFFLAHSPERIDPGNNDYTVSDIPKVAAGIGKRSGALVARFYGSFIRKVVPVSTVEAAELSKCLENTFRLVNISLINEISDLARTMDINIWEVISAAATKPYGFLPHYPGPGAGGYCIPVLPRYLASAAEENGMRLGLVEKAIEVNDDRPDKVVQETLALLRSNGMKNRHARVCLIGVSYKRGAADTRESVGLKIWEKLKTESIKVSYHDPYVPAVNGTASAELTRDFLVSQDLIIIVTAHQNIAYDRIVAASVPVLCTQNALAGYNDENIIRL